MFKVFFLKKQHRNRKNVGETLGSEIVEKKSGEHNVNLNCYIQDWVELQ